MATKTVDEKTYAQLVELLQLLSHTYPLPMQAGGVGHRAREILSSLGEASE